MACGTTPTPPPAPEEARSSWCAACPDEGIFPPQVIRYDFTYGDPDTPAINDILYAEGQFTISIYNGSEGDTFRVTLTYEDLTTEAFEGQGPTIVAAATGVVVAISLEVVVWSIDEPFDGLTDDKYELIQLRELLAGEVDDSFDADAGWVDLSVGWSPLLTISDALSGNRFDLSALSWQFISEVDDPLVSSSFTLTGLSWVSLAGDIDDPLDADLGWVFEGWHTPTVVDEPFDSTGDTVLSSQGWALNSTLSDPLDSQGDWVLIIKGWIVNSTLSDSFDADLGWIVDLAGWQSISMIDEPFISTVGWSFEQFPPSSVEDDLSVIGDWDLSQVGWGDTTLINDSFSSTGDWVAYDGPIILDVDDALTSNEGFTLTTGP